MTTHILLQLPFLLFLAQLWVGSELEFVVHNVHYVPVEGTVLLLGDLRHAFLKNKVCPEVDCFQYSLENSPILGGDPDDLVDQLFLQLFLPLLAH